MLLSATEERPPEDVTGTGQDLHDSRLDGEDVGADLAPDAAAEELTVADVRGGKPGEWKHGAYVLLSGKLTARHWLERAVRRACERLARDQGYSAYRDLPEARRGLVRRLAEVDAAASLMFAEAIRSGRFPVERYRELTSEQRQLAGDVGLSRVLKSATVPTLDEILTRRDGEEVRR